MSQFERLGRDMAALQDADREALLANGRGAESFIQALRNKRRRNPTPVLWAAALLIVAIPALVLWIRTRDEGKLTLSQPAGVSIGGSIVAPSDHAIPLHFSDGSRLWLVSGTRASVRELTANRASIDVENGKALVSVVHRPETRWLLRAGPYQVGVTGTKFDLEWQPERDRFTLELKEGSVVVTTDKSSHAAVKMVAPEHLIIDHGIWQLSPLRSDSAPEPTAGPTPRAPVAAQPPPVAANAPPVAAKAPLVAAHSMAASAPALTAPTSPQTATPPARDWQSLSKLGKYSEAYAQAQGIGIERLSQTASAQDLLTLAEICRFSGHTAQAVSVLTALRQRFASSEASAIAAFQLGRLVASGPRAAAWFRTYLRERPSGGLAREASGRLLEVLDRSGDVASATAAANHYIKSYPSGPHAAFARRVLGN